MPRILIGQPTIIGIGSKLLACVIEEVAGETFENFLKRELIGPVGLRETGFFHDPEFLDRSVAIGYTRLNVLGRVDRQWYHWGRRGHAGMLSTVDDLYRWDLALHGSTLLPAAQERKMFEPQVPAYGDAHYGYGGWLSQAGFCGTRYIGNNRLYRLPDMGFVVVLLGNSEGWDSVEENIRKSVLGQTFHMPPRTIRLEPTASERVCGVYSGVRDTRLIIHSKEGGLTVIPCGQPLLDTLTSSRPAHPDEPPNDTLNRRALQAVKAAHEQDRSSLETLVNPRWERRPTELVGLAKEWSLARGGFKNCTLMGTTRGAKVGVRTFVAVQYAQGLSVIQVTWDGDFVRHLHPDADFDPLGRFLPESPTKFVTYTLVIPRSNTLEFGLTRVRLRLADGNQLNFQREQPPP